MTPVFPSADHAWVLSLIQSIPEGEDMDIDVLAASASLTEERASDIISWLMEQGYLRADLAARQNPLHSVQYQSFWNVL